MVAQLCAGTWVGVLTADDLQVSWAQSPKAGARAISSHEHDGAMAGKTVHRRAESPRCGDAGS